ncbi:chemotaxis protein CheB [Rhodoferax sediminis]|uniref:protein-glutamate O-methyltransferase n=1 Tax=Rhodoferax sediminis TaxID=2509614 RepID=A0A515D8Y5_9BURK|nr:chemotaxis protein CheB [Rhodoferax sediminis]QDL36869.1 PAS domain-containing protein [Rhodoferax sediminis]
MGTKRATPKTHGESRTKVAAASKLDDSQKGGIAFPIVGMGASAGGLEAFEQFFRQVPPDCGLAFVLVQHLDPSHASILNEILQRSTTMPVVEAQDQMKVAPNSVYVIPPNRDLAILHGVLQLSLPEQPRGHRMPIDAFLRSLAEDQGEKAIGIVLSGTGTDGTLGLRAILGAGGMTLVQEPATAKYDGMPSSAIRAGYATQILPVDKMAAALQAGKRTLSICDETPSKPAATGTLNRILMLLRSRSGHDFSGYKKSTIGRRIVRRMAQQNIEDMEIYARYLKEHPAEVKALFKELLINVTSFFRDAEAFAVLKAEILPKLFADKHEGDAFRVWVTGCATGEEAYSIAILLREFMDGTQQEYKVQLYATDLDDDAIAIARAGVYPANIAQDVTPEHLRRFFVKEEDGYRVKKEIREMVVFAVQNVIKDPPFTKLDLLSCRNLMIYLEPELQDRLILAFHYALRPGGVLFLSPSESIGNHSEQFTVLNRKWKLYQAIHDATSVPAMRARGLSWVASSDGKAPEKVTQKSKETNFAEFAKRLLLQSAPASVVTDMKGNILYVHGDTGKYLRPAPGQATLNVIDMAREGLQLELRLAIQAGSRGTPTLSRELPVKSNGDFYLATFNVRPMQDVGNGYLLVSFQDISKAPPAKSKRRQPAPKPGELRRIEELERELAHTRENLQSTVEEQQASNEELKSTNEEMQSTNEELQSTNEELETSKEELQSVNEELVTVNAELQAKIEQLNDMQNDMKNLLDNINVGTVFLNEHLVIRRFTREAARIYRLVAFDVGRPLVDIKSDLEGDDLLDRAQAVLETLVPYEREARTADGTWYLVRIQPYRTLDNVIEGVVLTFTDISKRVAAEAEVREAKKFAEAIVDTVREPLVVLDASLKVISASRPFYRFFRVSPEETVGRVLYALGNNQWDTPSMRELLENILRSSASFDDVEVDAVFQGIGPKKMRLNARRIMGAGDSAMETQPLILVAMEEVIYPQVSTSGNGEQQDGQQVR